MSSEIQLTIGVLQVIIFIYAIVRIERAVKMHKETIAENNLVLEHKESVQKALLYFEGLRKQYYEMFIAELNNKETSMLIELATLQEEQQLAINEENYELAGKLQSKIELLTHFKNK